MNNTIIFIITFVIVSLIFLILMQIVYAKKRKLNQKLFLKYWPLIESAISDSNYLYVYDYTNKIFWNRNLSKANFDLIISFLKTHQTDNINSIELLQSINELYNQRGWNAVKR